MTPPAKQGRPPAGDRLSRLLVLIPWLVQRGGATIDEIADRFGIARDAVLADLSLASMCGVPPFHGGDFLDFTVTDERVTVETKWVFQRPPQLTAAQGFAVLAAGRTLLAVPGADPDGALTDALAKLERVLGDTGRVVVDLDEPEHLGLVRVATDEGRRLRIAYLSAWRDETTTREVEPHVVYHRDGRWYVEAFDHRSGEVRRFRIDRIESAVDTGDRFEPVRAEPPARVFDPGPEGTRVTVRVPPSGRWVVETYPVEVADDPDGAGGSSLVTFTVVGTTWLERLLLRLGPDAAVVEPPDFRDVGRAAARRLLAAYETGGSS